MPNCLVSIADGDDARPKHDSALVTFLHAGVKEQVQQAGEFLVLRFIVLRAGVMRASGDHPLGENRLEPVKFGFEVHRVLGPEALTQALINHQRVGNSLERFFVRRAKLGFLGMNARTLPGQALEVVAGGDGVH